jgi:hypothetical protein
VRSWADYVGTASGRAGLDGNGPTCLSRDRAPDIDRLRCEPLRPVDEAVFAVLALKVRAVDPGCDPDGGAIRSVPSL